MPSVLLAVTATTIMSPGLQYSTGHVNHPVVTRLGLRHGDGGWRRRRLRDGAHVRFHQAEARMAFVDRRGAAIAQASMVSWGPVRCCELLREPSLTRHLGIPGMPVSNQSRCAHLGKGLRSPPRAGVARPEPAKSAAAQRQRRAKRFAIMNVRRLPTEIRAGGFAVVILRSELRVGMPRCRATRV